MAAKNTIKQYQPNSFYHLYNRGVEKRNIFLDHQDYTVFLSYLKNYLVPKPINELRDKLNDKEINGSEKDKILKLIRMNNFYHEIELQSYCLMPNHFHLLIKQVPSEAIDRFMNSLCTRYATYFNKKVKRVGKLYQGVYKAVLVNSNEQLLQLSRYIHLNPLSKANPPNSNLESILLSQPSSYSNFLGRIKQNWIITQNILSFFNQESHQLSYQSFVEEGAKHFLTDIINNLALDQA